MSTSSVPFAPPPIVVNLSALPAIIIPIFSEDSFFIMNSMRDSFWPIIIGERNKYCMLLKKKEEPLVVQRLIRFEIHMAYWVEDPEVITYCLQIDADGARLEPLAFGFPSNGQCYLQSAFVKKLLGDLNMNYLPSFLTRHEMIEMREQAEKERAPKQAYKGPARDSLGNPLPRMKTLTVGYGPGDWVDGEPRGLFRFGGRYLRYFGFSYGTKVKMTIEPNKITLTPAGVVSDGVSQVETAESKSGALRAG